MSDAAAIIPSQLQEDLPEGWRMAAIGELLKIRNGYAFKSTDYKEDGVLLVRQSNLGGDTVSLNKAKFLPKGFLKHHPDFQVKKGDILIGMSGSIGKLCSYHLDESALQNQRTGLLIFQDEEQKPWVWHYLPLLEKGLKEIGKGVAVQNVSAKQIESFSIPVAPLEDQKRIVAEIERQFSRLDEAVASLKRVKANLKRYKAAVLKAAVEGKLTEEWRKQNPDVEPASKLLERILAERRGKWEEAQLAKMKAKGKEPKNDKWKEKYKPPPTVDTQELPELPNGWVWSNLEQLAEATPNALKAGPFGSALKKSFYVKKGYKIYGQEQVIRGDAYYGDYYIDQDRYQSLSSCAVKPGDLLISLVGTIGRVLILPENIESGIINPRLVKISMDRRMIFPEFLAAYLGSPLVKAIFSIASHGGTMDVLNLTILKSVPIPVSPKAEQEFVLSEIDRIETLEKNLEGSIRKSSMRFRGLRSSVLRNAFSGELA